MYRRTKSTRTFASLVLGGFLLFSIAGCDSSGGLDDDAANVSAEETAESIAISLGEETGGVASDLKGATDWLSSGAKATLAKDITRKRECTYDDSDQAWTCTFLVEGTRGRIDSVGVQRTVRAEFYNGGSAVRYPSEADSLMYELQAGDGMLVTPRLDHSHTLLPSKWSIAREQSDTYAIALESTEAGRDVTGILTGEKRKRERTAEIRRTDTENLLWEEGTGLISGTIIGTYDATVTVTRADDSTAKRTVRLEYTATFSEGSIEVTLEGGGERFNGETFEFDRSGLVR